MKFIIKSILLNLFCILLSTFAYAGSGFSADQIIGSWQLVSMSKQPQEEVTPTDILFGYSEYHDDGTYFAYFKWRDFPDKDPAIIKGRYILDENKIIHLSSDGKSILGSAYVKFEDGYLILDPKSEIGFVTYNKKTEKREFTHNNKMKPDD